MHLLKSLAEDAILAPRYLNSVTWLVGWVHHIIVLMAGDDSLLALDTLIIMMKILSKYLTSSNPWTPRCKVLRQACEQCRPHGHTYLLNSIVHYCTNCLTREMPPHNLLPCCNLCLFFSPLQVMLHKNKRMWEFRSHGEWKRLKSKQIDIMIIATRWRLVLYGRYIKSENCNTSSGVNS